MIKADSQIVATEADGYRILGYCRISVESKLKPYTSDVLKAELKAILECLQGIDPDIISDAFSDFIVKLTKEVDKHDKNNRS